CLGRCSGQDWKGDEDSRSIVPRPSRWIHSLSVSPVPCTVHVRGCTDGPVLLKLHPHLPRTGDRQIRPVRAGYRRILDSGLTGLCISNTHRRSTVPVPRPSLPLCLGSIL